MKIRKSKKPGDYRVKGAKTSWNERASTRLSGAIKALGSKVLTHYDATSVN